MECPNCQFYDKINDIKYIFLFCSKVREFWDSLFEWWSRIVEVTITLTFRYLEESSLFGFHLEAGISPDSKILYLQRESVLKMKTKLIFSDIWLKYSSNYK